MHFRLRLPGREAQTYTSFILAILIGLGGGGFAYLFRQMINGAQSLFFDKGAALATLLGSGWVIVIPALGGLVVGPLVYFFAREAKGHGVPEVMEAVALKGGRMRLRVIIIKAIASATCIGSGGSVGREGPIIQMGSAIGSVLGQTLKVPEKTLRTLVGCGAAAGISATFNTPIAGVFFAQEVILREFTASNFTLLTLSSVSASVVGRMLLGNNPAFMVPPYELHHPTELLFYIILGLAAAIIGTAFTRLLYFTEDVFDNLKIVPPYLKPAVGGVLLGLIGWQLPQVFGVGYETITEALSGNLTLNLLGILLLAKLIATSLTLGSGGSGGVFAPSLFMGSMLGGVLGNVAHSLYPAITATPGAYALVGMGAVVAATTHAPIQAILIVFEMTLDYRIILPLMIACVVSHFLAQTLSRESIYTLKLTRRGINLHSDQDLEVLRQINVAEAMSKEVVAVKESNTLGDVITLMQQYHYNGFPVIDDNGRLKGLITLEQVRNTYPYKPEERLKVSVADVMLPKVYTISPSENLEEAFHKFARYQVDRLVVVEAEDTKKVVGILTVKDLISAYYQQLASIRSTKRQSASPAVFSDAEK